MCHLCYGFQLHANYESHLVHINQNEMSDNSWYRFRSLCLVSMTKTEDQNTVSRYGFVLCTVEALYHVSPTSLVCIETSPASK